MKRIAWTTDIHLDFLEDSNQIERFCQNIVEANPDSMLIGGDIAIAATVDNLLLLPAKHLQCPIYFVLGNHDFYKGSIVGVRAKVAQLTRRSCDVRIPRRPQKMLSVDFAVCAVVPSLTV